MISGNRPARRKLTEEERAKKQQDDANRAAARKKENQEKRQKQEEDRHNADRQVRFRTIHMLAIEVGEKNVTIQPRTLPNGKHLKGYDGPAKIFAKQARNQQVMYVAKPPNWKNASPLVSITGMKWHPKVRVERLIPKLETKIHHVLTLEAAEGSPDPAKRITKIEADLASKWEQCLKQALRWCCQAGFSDRLSMGSRPWPVEEQRAGKDLYKALENAYGRDALPSPEAVSIAAAYLQAHWNECPRWFLADPRYVDCFLRLFHDRVYKRTGRVSQRRTYLVGLPFRPENTPLKVTDQTALDTMLEKGTDKSVVDATNLAHLTNLSPIAAAVLLVDEISDEVSENALKEAQAILGPARKYTYKNKHFDEWLQYFYSKTNKVPERPRTIGPQSVLLSRDIAQVHPQAAQTTHEMREKMDPFSHWELVIMVWRDFVLPYTNNGRVDDLVEIKETLQVMVAGNRPGDIGKEGATKGQEDEGDEEEDVEGDVEPDDPEPVYADDPVYIS